MTRVLILHMRYAPDATGTGPLVTELAEDLAAAGDQVRVITTVPHYGRGKVPAAYRFGLVFREHRNGVDVWRTAAFPWASGTVLGRGIDYLMFTALSALLGLLGPRPEVILSMSPPVTVGFSAGLVKSVRRVPLVFNAQDIWPDGLVEMGRLRTGRLLALFHALERWVYRVADLVTVVSQGMKENLVAKGVPAQKIEVVPNWVDLEAIQPLGPEDSLRDTWGLTDKFVVLFAGNLGFAAGLEHVVAAANRLRDDREIQFLIVGEGSAKSEVVARSRELGLQNILFMPTQPKDRLSRLLATADLSLVTLRAGMGSLSVPSKTLAYLASGRPILAAVPQDSEIRRLIEDCGCGLVASPEEPAAIAEAIHDAKAMGPELGEMGARGRRLAADRFRRERLVHRIRQLLQDLARSERAPAGPSRSQE